MNKKRENNITAGFSCIYAKDKLIMCGTQNGLNISQDAGNTWKRVSRLNELKNDKLKSIDYNGESIIIGTSLSENGAGVFRSNDMGKTWSNHYIEQIETTRVKCYENKVYVSLRNNSMNIIDLETNKVENFGPNEMIKNFSIFKNKIYLCNWSGTYPLFVSEDQGQNWTGYFKNILRSHRFSCIAFMNDIIVAGTTKNGILLINADYKIIKVIKNLPSIHITSILTQNNTIFAGTPQGFAVSNDSGETWKTFENLNTQIKGMAIDSNKLYIATTFECHVFDIVEK